MKRVVALTVMLVCFASLAIAVEGDQVLYVAGSVANIPLGTIGKFDTSGSSSLRFVSGTSSIDIPYKNVVTYSEESEVAHHLGVLPAVAVGLVRARHRLHFLHISYKDENGTPQTLEFEIPKQMPKPLMDLLRARVPSKLKPSEPCHRVGPCAS